MLSASPDERLVWRLLVEHKETVRAAERRTLATLTGRAAVEAYIDLQVQLGYMTRKEGGDE